jgi:hypothetical protein
VKRAASAATLALAIAWTPAAFADDATPSRATMESDMRGYYGGERLSAYAIGGTGVLAATAGAYLVTRDTDFERGLGWPLLVMGGLEAIGATVYAYQVGSEIDHYGAALARDPAAYRTEEADHIRGTSSRFVIYRITELSLTLGGAAALGYGLATNRDVWKGAGLGVAALALPFFVIDSVNDARAKRYLDRVESFHPTLSVQPAVAERGLFVSLGSKF